MTKDRFLKLFIFLIIPMRKGELTINLRTPHLYDTAFRKNSNCKI